MAMLSSPVKEYFEFDSFQVDVGRRLLLRDGEVVTLAPRVFRLLLALIRHSGTLLTKDDLLKELWPDAVVEENNLTVIISVLRKALGEDPHQHRYIVTVPGRGYSFVAEVREIRDELGEQVKKERVKTGYSVEVEEQSHSGEPDILMRGKKRLRLPSSNLSHLQLAGRKVPLTALSLMILTAALAYFWISTKPKPPEAETPVKTLAVLPFKQLSGESDEEFLGLGMADALITKLGNLRQVITRPTRAVLKYSGADSDPLVAGRELGVDALIDGRIQRLNDNIRVTVQLIRVSDGALLWSERFDEKFTSIFVVQDAIAEQMSRALLLRLSREERKRLVKRQTVDPEAYQRYLRGRYFWNKRTAEGLKKGLEYFSKATEKDPGYALAYAGLADCYNLLSYYSVLPPKDSFPKAKAAAVKALEFDDTLAEAHTSLALAAMAYERDWASAEKEYKRAIELNPNYPTAHQWYAEFLAAMGRSDEAISEIHRAQELDPLSLITNAAEGFINYYAHRYDQATAQLQKLLELDEHFWPARWFLGRAYVAQGNYREAIAEFEKARTLPGDSTGVIIELGYAYAVSGKRAEARKMIGELMEQSKRNYVSPYGIAMIYVGLGDKVQAFNWLQKAHEERTWDLVYLKVDPKLDSLRPDPRFAELLRRLRFVF